MKHNKKEWLEMQWNPKIEEIKMCFMQMDENFQEQNKEMIDFIEYKYKKMMNYFYGVK